jgi:hypothetical protein
LAAAAPAAGQATARQDAEASQQRYEIAVLERVLEGAVEHGVAVTRDRLQAVSQMPTELLVSDNAHARGFRLEGYGVFFDVSVPSFETTLWTMRMLDQNVVGLDNAMRELQQVVKGNANAEQALKRIELQVNPMSAARQASQKADVTDPRNATGSTAAIAGDADRPAPASQDPILKDPILKDAILKDPILKDPNDAYRGEVMKALKEAMLAHSSSLGIRPDEWLTIAARGNDDRPRLAPADVNSRTRIMRLRGSDLAAYLARQITKDEALERIEVRVY